MLGFSMRKVRLTEGRNGRTVPSMTKLRPRTWDTATREPGHAVRS